MWLIPGSIRRLVDNVERTADVLEYVYAPNNAGSLAQQLLAEGPNLLRDLYDRCTRNHVWSQQRAVRRSWEQLGANKVPTVFVCHGTGGFVLKDVSPLTLVWVWADSDMWKAHCICRQQFVNYRPVIDMVARAIFLSVPHFIKEKNKAKATSDLLIKCQRQRTSRSRWTVTDMDNLINICRRFELLNLRVPIISAFESRETSIQLQLLSKFSKKSRASVVRKSPIVYDSVSND